MWVLEGGFGVFGVSVLWPWISTGQGFKGFSVRVELVLVVVLAIQQKSRTSSIKGVTVLPLNMLPKKIFHRTNQKGLAGILQGV